MEVKTMDLMNIYNHSPIWMQNVLTSMKGNSLKHKRYNTVYKKALEEYLSRDYSDYQKLTDYQWERTEELIHYAFQNSPFYRKFYGGIDLKEVTARRDLSLLPILENHDMQFFIDLIAKYQLTEKIYMSSNNTLFTFADILPNEQLIQVMHTHCRKITKEELLASPLGDKTLFTAAETYNGYYIADYEGLEE